MELPCRLIRWFEQRPRLGPEVFFVPGSRGVSASAPGGGFLLGDPSQHLVASVDDFAAQGETGRPHIAVAPVTERSDRDTDDVRNLFGTQ